MERMTSNKRFEIFKMYMKDVPNCDAIATWCLNNGYFTAPASTKYHGNYEGGLFDHSFNVMKTLTALTNRAIIHWERPCSPIIVGLFHDLCKADNYTLNRLGTYEYNTDTSLTGHGDKSVMLLSTLLTLTNEEMFCIRYHMGAFTDKEEWKYYTNAIHKYPNVLWTHTADMIATHITEVADEA